LKSSPDDIDKIREKVDKVFVATRSTREEMLRHRRLFEGNLYDVDQPEFDSYDKSTVQYNILFSTIQQIAPLLLDNRPIPRVIPRWPFMTKLANVMNNIVKYAWDTMELQAETYKVVTDAMISKLGVFKVWCDKDQGHVIECVDPIDFFIAPGYDDPWKAPFSGTRCLKPLEWAQTTFPEVKKIQAGKGKPENHDTDRAFKYAGANASEADAEWVEVTEIWMRDGTMVDKTDEDGKKTKVQKYPHGKLLWFTPHQKLKEMPAPDNHGKAPYVLNKSYLRPHDVTGISDIEMIEGLHKDINLMLKAYSDHIRKYSNQNELMDTTSGFDVETYKQNRTKGGQAFAWDSRNGSLKPPVSRIENPEPHPLMGDLIEAFAQIVGEVSGVTDLGKGQVGKPERQSAVEIGVLHDMGGIRTRQRLRFLEQTLGRVLWLFLRNVMQYQNEPEYFPHKEQNGVGYTRYGNSKAQATEIIEPARDTQLEKLISWSQDSGVPLSEEDQAKLQEFQQETEDFRLFAEKFEDVEGEFDPILFPFRVQIDADSMLPMDQQSRANVLIRILQMAPPEAQSAMFELVLEQLQVKNSDSVVEAMEEAKQQMQQKKAAMMKQKMSPEDQAAAQKNPEQYKQYVKEQTQ